VTWAAIAVAVEQRRAVGGQVAQAAPEPDLAPRGVVTSDRELRAFEVISIILSGEGRLQRTVFDSSTRKDIPVELAYKDTTAYFGVYFNKTSWWFMRLFVEGRQPWVGFNLAPEELRRFLPPGTEIIEHHAFADSGVRVTTPEDLLSLKQAVLGAADAMLAAHNQTPT